LNEHAYAHFGHVAMISSLMLGAASAAQLAYLGGLLVTRHYLPNREDITWQIASLICGAILCLTPGLALCSIAVVERFLESRILPAVRDTVGDFFAEEVP
jgi:hypothetical protein